MARPSRASAWLRELMSDKVRRAIAATMLGVPANLVFAVWKIGLGIVEASLFLVAAGAVNVGLGVAKYLALRAHAAARGRGTTHPGEEAAVFRRIVWLLLGLSAGFTLCSLPSALGSESMGRVDEGAAVLVAALTFTELGFAVHGIVSARRNRSLLVEAIKQTNLVGALVLVALTQATLLTVFPAQSEKTTGAAGLVFGLIASAHCAWLLWRGRTRVGSASGAGAATGPGPVSTPDAVAEVVHPDDARAAGPREAGTRPEHAGPVREGTP
ncbi:hypothetical protein ACFVU2_18235 [Leifsonia sp. NPDC058194]|uniref:hypothetical protein n=1 Tax=Leifsonia sp. NPDC058194 TaxID=3346374 RepID=UPI0036D79748